MKGIFLLIISMVYTTGVYGQIIAGKAKYITPINSTYNLTNDGLVEIGVDLDGDNSADFEFSINRSNSSSSSTWKRRISGQVMNSLFSVANVDSAAVGLEGIRHYNYGDTISTSRGVWGINSFVIANCNRSGPIYPNTEFFKDTSYLGFSFQNQLGNSAVGWLKYGYGEICTTPFLNIFEIGLDTNISPSIITSNIGLESVNTISVSPNPTTRFINVELPEGLNQIKYYLVSVRGEIIESGILKSRIEQVDLSKISNQIIFIRIELPEGEVLVKKIIKMD